LRRSFVVVGYIPYLAFSGKVGSLLLAVGDENGALRFAGAVARGFSARMRIELAILLERDHVTAPATVGTERRGVEHWVVPRYTAEIEFSGWASSGRPRFPTFLRLR
jgi:bifunctional non-homologous end joining protein LigD